MTRKATKEEQRKTIFPPIITDAVNECNSLFKLFLNEMTSLAKKYNKDFKELKLFVDEIGVKEDGLISIPYRKFKKYKELSKKVYQDECMIKMCPKFTLSHLVQIYDSFLSKLLMEVFFFYPGVSSLCDKALKLEMIKNESNVDEIKRKFISYQIEEIMRDSHNNQIEWIDKKLKTSIKKSFKMMREFVFLTELRNIIIHNNGKVNSIFKTNLKKSGWDVSKYNNNEEVDLTLEIVKQSFDTVISLMITIYISLCNKLFKKEEDLVTCINDDIIYEYLLEQNYNKVSLISNLLMDIGLNILQGVLNVVKVNLAIAYRNSSIDKYKEIITGLGDDTTGDKLARAVLLEQYDLAACIFKEMGNNEGLYRGSFEWPLFDKFRKTEPFKNAFKEVFGEEFEMLKEPEAIFEEKEIQYNSEEKE